MRKFFFVMSLLLIFINMFICGITNDGFPTLKLIYQHPTPVITVHHPDAENNKFGFEGGTVLKVGNTYHLFTSEMIDNPMWVKMRLAHWVSSDKITWKRAATIRTSTGDFTGNDPRAALWSPMVVWDAAENRWNLFYVAYNSAPCTPDQMRLNMNGKIFRSVSETTGKEGINGAFIDKGIVLQSDSVDSWEGLQGTDSFYPYLVDNKWYAFYGSANTEKMPIEHWLVGYAKSKSSSIAGPWKRCSEINPSKIEKTFIENPIVTKIKSGYLVIYDNLTADGMGWSYSKDGFHWGEGQSLIIQPNSGKWSKDVRTVLGLVDEGNGKYTVFYTGFEQTPDWGRLLTGIGQETCAVGFVEIQIVETYQ